jgi:hypothetical protein
MNKPRAPIRRYSFLLLELLLSLILISLCFFPLVQSHLKIFLVEKKRLLKTQFALEAEEVSAKLYQYLFEHPEIAKLATQEEQVIDIQLDAISARASLYPLMTNKTKIKVIDAKIQFFNRDWSPMNLYLLFECVK